MTTHPADSHDLIAVRGARENNLRGVDLDLPKRRMTVFTGVSGSGKSSLVFDTIAAESQRMINETYPAFVQGFMESLARPDVDSLSGLTTAIIVDQERMGANPRSTLGTATDASALLRILFATAGEPKIGGPGAFSFNVPSVSAQGAITVQKGAGTTREVATFERTGGMCPTCQGTGTSAEFDLDELFDKTKSLSQGALTVPGYTMDGWYGRIFRDSGYFDMDKPLGRYTKKELHHLLHQAPTKIKAEGINVTYEGLIPKITKSMLSKDIDSLQKHVRAFVERVVVQGQCPDCHGTRLSAQARSVRVAGKNIAEVSALPLTEAHQWLTTVPPAGIEPLLANLRDLLDSFLEIGLGYLTLDRPAGSLSGGEAQRTKMVRHLGSALTDVTYVFDEPTIGLHPHDIESMNGLLLRLRDKGNTVLVVEHKAETIAIADRVVDLGPRAGTEGGTITYQGDVAGLRASGTLTGTSLASRVALKDSVRAATGAIEIRGASTHNLRAVDVDIPLGVLTVVTGVAGSGKSSLIQGHLAAQDGVVVVDQGAISGSRRSNPATYTGLLDPIRKAFAKANGVKPALFSANSEGACPACNGVGLIFTEIAVMSTVSAVCGQCGGKRYNPEVLQYTLGGKDISEVLHLSVAQALDFFSGAHQPEAKVPAAGRILDRLADAGLGYISLGQPLSTLSGGERQRLKLAVHLANPGRVFVLDEPTTGLHLADVRHVLALLDRIVDSGITVVVIEHHQAVMAHADWIIDLGPGAGSEGGEVVFTGSPRQLVEAEESARTLTGQHLARYLN